MWVLIYIKLLFPMDGTYEVDTQIFGQYVNFSKCFQAREELILEMGQLNGFPKPNTQVVCIRTK